MGCVTVLHFLTHPPSISSEKVHQNAFLHYDQQRCPPSEFQNQFYSESSLPIGWPRISPAVPINRKLPFFLGLPGAGIEDDEEVGEAYEDGWPDGGHQGEVVSPASSKGYRTGPVSCYIAWTL
jgi:hypothetical protein